MMCTFNKKGEILPKELVTGNAVYSCIFSRKSIEMDPFMSQKIISMTFFDDFCAWNIFFIVESVCFYSMDYLFNSSS